MSICSAFGFIYYILGSDCYTFTGISKWIYSTNLRIYGVFLTLFMSILFMCKAILTLLFHRKESVLEKSLNFDMKWQIFATLTMVTIGIVLFSHWSVVEQFNEVGVANGTYYDFPIILRIVFMGCICLWGIFMTVKNRDISRETLYMVCIYSLVVTFMGLYIVNPFEVATVNDLTQDFSMGMSDNSSTTESIYNTLDGVPFTYMTSVIYGHYALVFSAFLFPFKNWGGVLPYLIMGLLAGFGCLAHLAAIYAIDVFSEKRWIKVILILAAMVRTTYTYPAIFPIRTLFPLLLCGYMAFLYKRKKVLWKSKWMWFGFMLCSLAVLWNTETGLACIVGYIFYLFVEQWQNHLFLEKHMLYLYIGVGLMSLGCVFLPIVIVNVYNFMCGYRTFDVGVFFFPYINSSFATGIIRCNLPLGNHAWVYIIILLLGTLCWSIYHTNLWQNKGRYISEASAIAGISMIGIVVFAYYVNEAHWGCMDIVRQISVVLSAVIISRLWAVLVEWKKLAGVESIFQKSVVIIALFVYLILAMQVFSDPCRIAARHRAGAYSLNKIEQDIEVLRAEIPENIYGVGQGINTIYHMLGWDNHAKYRDTSAIKINAEGKDAFTSLKNEVLNQGAFLIGDSAWDQALLNAVLAEDNTYVMNKQVRIGSIEYSYYIRKR